MFFNEICKRKKKKKKIPPPKKRVLKHTRVVNQGLMVRRARNNLEALKNLMIKREGRRKKNTQTNKRESGKKSGGINLTKHEVKVKN